MPFYVTRGEEDRGEPDEHGRNRVIRTKKVSRGRDKEKG